MITRPGFPAGGFPAWEWGEEGHNTDPPLNNKYVHTVINDSVVGRPKQLLLLRFSLHSCSYSSPLLLTPIFQLQHLYLHCLDLSTLNLHYYFNTFSTVDIY
jgi:hypothetical protein